VIVTPAVLSPAAEDVWGVILDCAHQVRAAPMGGVLGLDFTAAFLLGQARGADPALLADVLPRVEPFIIFAWSPPPQ
jgi:hypothetical protein